MSVEAIQNTVTDTGTYEQAAAAGAGWMGVHRTRSVATSPEGL
jgi:hypothetical protein